MCSCALTRSRRWRTTLFSSAATLLQTSPKTTHERILKAELDGRRISSRMYQIWLLLLLGGFVGPGELHRLPGGAAGAADILSVESRWSCLTEQLEFTWGGIKQDPNTPAGLLWHLTCEPLHWTLRRECAPQHKIGPGRGLKLGFSHVKSCVLFSQGRHFYKPDSLCALGAKGTSYSCYYLRLVSYYCFKLCNSVTMGMFYSTVQDCSLSKQLL